MPPNNGMELTGKSITPFARGRAKGAPLLPVSSSQSLGGAKGRRSGKSIEESKRLARVMIFYNEVAGAVGVGVWSNLIRRHAPLPGGICTTLKKEGDD